MDMANDLIASFPDNTTENLVVRGIGVKVVLISFGDPLIINARRKLANKSNLSYWIDYLT